MQQNSIGEGFVPWGTNTLKSWLIWGLRTMPGYGFFKATLPYLPISHEPHKQMDWQPMTTNDGFVIW